MFFYLLLCVLRTAGTVLSAGESFQINLNSVSDCDVMAIIYSMVFSFVTLSRCFLVQVDSMAYIYGSTGGLVSGVESESFTFSMNAKVCKKLPT